PNRHLRYNPFLPLDGGFAECEQCRVVERLVKTVILRNLAVTPNLGSHFGLIKDLAKIQSARLPVIDCFLGLEPIGAANHFVERPETKPCHQFTDFLRDETHKVDSMSGVAGEIFAQVLRLRGYPDRTSV